MRGGGAAPVSPAGYALIAPELSARGIAPSAAQRERLERYAALLLHWNRRINLVGTHDPAELWQRHLLDCLMLQAVPRDPALQRWVDVGSGAGLPGIVWAIVHPELHVTAVESVARKATFLQEAARQLGLSNFACVRQDVHRLAATPGFATFDALLVRAFGPLGGVLRLGLELVRPGGELWAMKGRRWAAEAEQVPPEVRAGYRSAPAVHPYRLGEGAEAVILVYRRAPAVPIPA
jgi:16S rRNA (guanine527-N7)-methyltransferase